MIVMDQEMQSGSKFHISNIDDYLATLLLYNKARPLKLFIKVDGDQGYYDSLLLETDDLIEGEGIDFELSPLETLGHESIEVSYFLGKPVFTSSAYEFFDYLFLNFNSLEFLVDFKDNAWQVKIVKAIKT